MLWTNTRKRILTADVYHNDGSVGATHQIRARYCHCLELRARSWDPWHLDLWLLLLLLVCQCLFPDQCLILHCSCSFVLDDFQRYQIDISLLCEHAQCAMPASVVISNVTTGSRTILHMNRNLPDVTAADFSKVDLSQYKWIHLEGRNADEQVKMIQQVAVFNSQLPLQQKITVSVEIEKTRDALYQLFPCGDVVFVSKDVAMHFGFDSAASALKGLYSRVRTGAVLICAWAEKGADALGSDGVVVHSDAFPPEALVDTLGAGDTFNASVIHSLSKGESLQEALRFGCQVAGRKCGVHGYEGVVIRKE